MCVTNPTYNFQTHYLNTLIFLFGLINFQMGSPLKGNNLLPLLNEIKKDNKDCS